MDVTLTGYLMKFRCKDLSPITTFVIVPNHRLGKRLLDLAQVVETGEKVCLWCSSENLFGGDVRRLTCRLVSLSLDAVVGAEVTCAASTAEILSFSALIGKKEPDELRFRLTTGIDPETGEVDA